MNIYTLITGASSGIGEELAKVFAKNRHNLILIARNQKKLEELQLNLESRYNIKVQILSIDLKNQDSPDKILEYIQNNNFKVQILINNAGYGTNGFFLTNDYQQEIEEIQLNIESLVKLTYLLGNLMLKDSKDKPRFYYKILNVASTAAFQPGPFMSNYYATKSYVLHFSEGLYEELKSKNILVSVLCPGPTRTNFFHNANITNASIKKLPFIMSAEEVANYCYQKLIKNKVIIIPGIMNKIGVISIRFFPRFIIRKITKSMNKNE